jgi:hypothetical protein
MDPRFAKAIWDKNIAIQEKFNEPGRFTAFIGFGSRASDIPEDLRIRGSCRSRAYENTPDSGGSGSGIPAALGPAFRDVLGTLAPKGVRTYRHAAIDPVDQEVSVSRRGRDRRELNFDE